METPYIAIEESIAEQNIERMANLAKENGVQLRPHIKTHKLPSFAKKQLAQGAVGITVATISEAEVMASAGINDIFIAYPIVTESKAEQLILLKQKVSNLIVGVDSMFGANILHQIAKKHNEKIQVRLEIDTGLSRTGVSPETAADIAEQVVQLDHLVFEGIFTFKGAVYEGEGTRNLEAAGKEEGEMMIRVATAIKERGINISSISVGSSPSAATVVKVAGVTEVRPGTYIFNDVMQEAFGLCTWEDCAAHVVCTVVSKSKKGHIVIDGGSKTFATDVQPDGAPLYLKGFGKVKGYPNAVFERMNEEHGVIELNGEDINIGDQISIIPNHICSTVNLHNHVFIKKQDNSVEKLDVAARGKLQ